MNGDTQRIERVLSSLEQLYREVDRLVEPLTEAHRHRLRCREGCNSCCIEGITVFEVEALNIRRHLEELAGPQQAHEPGACAFLDASGSCRIYSSRPYVCRTQGLPLRWIDEESFQAPVEMRDICPLNDNGEPIEELPEEECWSIGPFESRLAALQVELSGGGLRRVGLRDLFGENRPEAVHAGPSGNEEEDLK
jgi:Fe-S-cluster containining protein